MKANFDLDPAQWATLRRLLDTALALAPAERTSWLGDLPAEHQALKPRLQRLLAHAGGGDSPLDSLPKVETAQFLAERAAKGEATGFGPGAGVGPYRLLRVLGEGGMGQVWLAERADMLQRRQVALKLPRLLTGRAALAERLAREREILAALNHPHIARLYDAGLAADGQPYLALEYVQGERIDAYCQRQALQVPARLRLFLQVARAIAHAHAQLVVHRDLKPANILVTEAGEVRLLDFGIAKLVEDGPAHETELTQLAGRALTPEYAAPEQILGQPIATSADVYALGVVLFELLTGQRPYKLKRDSRAALEEAIVAAEAPRPSSVVAEPKLRKRLRGDLDTICLKALKKAPAERYRSVEALAEDIERHLEQRPVLAQPDSRTYRLRKFVARNRLAVGAAASVMLAILVGAAVAVWQARAAIAEAKRSAEVKQFVVSMFQGIDPNHAGTARSVTAAEILELAEQRLRRGLGEQPGLRIELLLAVARSYAGLYDYRRALEVATLARAEIEAAGAADPTVHADLALLQAKAHKELGDLDSGERVLREFQAAQPGAGDVSSMARARLLEAEIAHQRGQWQKTVDLALAVLAADRGEKASEMRAWGNLLAAHGYGMLRQKPLALQHAERAYLERLELHGQDRLHPQVFMTAQSYAAMMLELGQVERALPILHESLQAVRRVYGPASALLVEYGTRLGYVELERGRIDVALELLEEADRIAEQRKVPETIMRGGQLRVLARAYIRRRDFSSAALKLQRSLQIMSAFKNEAVMRVVQTDLAFVRAFLEPAADAIAELERISAAQDAADPRYRSHLPAHYLGVLLRLQNKPLRAVEVMQQAEAMARANTRRSDLAEALIDQAAARIEAADAEAAERLADEGLRLLRQIGFEQAPAVADAQTVLGRVALARGLAEQATEHLARADSFWQAFDGKSRWAGEAAFYLAQSLEAQGRKAEAKEPYGRAARILSHSPFPLDVALVKIAQP